MIAGTKLILHIVVTGFGPNLLLWLHTVSTRVMGTYGYCAPEYAMTGQLTVKSDVYSFGVVFLELITGRKAIDSEMPHGEQNLVAWVNN